MYGTIIYVRSEGWPPANHLTLENVTKVTREGARLCIEGLGTQRHHFQERQGAQVGMLMPDGSRLLVNGIFERQTWGYGLSGPEWAMTFYGCETHSLPMHPHEAERRAYIAAEKDRQRLADLGMSCGQDRPSAEALARAQRMLASSIESEYVAEFKGSPSRGFVDPKVREEFEGPLLELCDDMLSTGEEGVQKIMEMITTRIGMAREGL